MLFLKAMGNVKLLDNLQAVCCISIVHCMWSQTVIGTNKAAHLPTITKWIMKVKIFTTEIYPANTLWQKYFKILLRLDQSLVCLPHIL
jgi:hypothetical protein